MLVASSVPLPWKSWAFGDFDLSLVAYCNCSDSYLAFVEDFFNGEFSILVATLPRLSFVSSTDLPLDTAFGLMGDCELRSLP